MVKMGTLVKELTGQSINRSKHKPVQNELVKHCRSAMRRSAPPIDGEARAFTPVPHFTPVQPVTGPAHVRNPSPPLA